MLGSYSDAWRTRDVQPAPYRFFLGSTPLLKGEGGRENGTQVACTQFDFMTVIGSISFPVQAGQTYHVFVGGLNNQPYAQGPTKLHATLTP